MKKVRTILVVFLFLGIMPILGINNVNADDIVINNNGKIVNPNWILKEYKNIDPKGIGDIVNSFPVPGTSPRSLAWDGEHLWHNDGNTMLIYKLNPVDGSILDIIPIEAGSTPQGLTWDGQYLWMSRWEDSTLYQIDSNNGTVIKTISSPTFYPFDLTWDGNYLWLKCTNEGFKQIDPTNGDVIHSIPEVSDGWGLTWDGQYLWSDSLRPTFALNQMDPTDGTILQSISIEFMEWPLGATWDGQYIWVVDLDGRMIYQIDVGLPPIWQKAYNTLFDSPSYLELLRQYRDKVLSKTTKGEMYKTLLYMSSEEALEVLLDNPELMLEAKDLIEANKDAVSEVLNGNEGVIYNTDEIISFLDAYAKKSPAALEILANMVKRDMLKKQKQSNLFLGFELK